MDARRRNVGVDSAPFVWNKRFQDGLQLSLTPPPPPSSSSASAHANESAVVSPTPMYTSVPARGYSTTRRTPQPGPSRGFFARRLFHRECTSPLVAQDTWVSSPLHTFSASSLSTPVAASLRSPSTAKSVVSWSTPKHKQEERIRSASPFSREKHFMHYTMETDMTACKDDEEAVVPVARVLDYDDSDMDMSDEDDDNHAILSTPSPQLQRYDDELKLPGILARPQRNLRYKAPVPTVMHVANMQQHVRVGGRR